MAQWGNVCSTKPDDLSSINQTYQVERKKQLSSQVVVVHTFSPSIRKQRRWCGLDRVPGQGYNFVSEKKKLTKTTKVALTSCPLTSTQVP